MKPIEINLSRGINPFKNTKGRKRRINTDQGCYSTHSSNDNHKN